MASGPNGTMPRPVAAVFFDAGDTLLAPYPSFHGRFTEVAIAHGEDFEHASVEAAYAAAMRRAEWPTDWTDPATQRTFWEGFYREVLAELGPTATDTGELATAMFDTFSDPHTYRLFPDVRPVLEELRRRGVVLGVISNFEPWLTTILELQQVDHLFATVAISGVLGVSKPDAAIFKAALNEAGVEAAATVHVGDQPVADVEGSRAVGMTPVLIDRFGRNGPVDALRITELGALLELLDS